MIRHGHLAIAADISSCHQLSVLRSGESQRQMSHLGQARQGGNDIIEATIAQHGAVGHVQGLEVAQRSELRKASICDVLAEAQVELTKSREPRQGRHVAISDDPELGGVQDATATQVQVLEIGQRGQDGQIRLGGYDLGVLQVELRQLGQAGESLFMHEACWAPGMSRTLGYACQLYQGTDSLNTTVLSRCQ